MESVGLESTAETLYQVPKALLTELRLLFVPIQDVFSPFDRTHTHTHIGWFLNKLLLTTTLMIRATTHLVPSRFLAYNQLLKALTGLMVIAYIMHIGKVI